MKMMTLPAHPINIKAFQSQRSMMLVYITEAQIFDRSTLILSAYYCLSSVIIQQSYSSCESSEYFVVRNVMLVMKPGPAKMAK